MVSSLWLVAFSLDVALGLLSCTVSASLPQGMWGLSPLTTDQTHIPHIRQVDSPPPDHQTSLSFIILVARPNVGTTDVREVWARGELRDSEFTMREVCFPVRALTNEWGQDGPYGSSTVYFHPLFCLSHLLSLLISKSHDFGCHLHTGDSSSLALVSLQSSSLTFTGVLWTPHRDVGTCTFSKPTRGAILLLNDGFTSWEHLHIFWCIEWRAEVTESPASFEARFIIV